jgi:hypothetical protein
VGLQSQDPQTAALMGLVMGGIGAAVGATVDKYGRQMTKKAIDSVDAVAKMTQEGKTKQALQMLNKIKSEADKGKTQAIITRNLINQFYLGETGG